MIRPHTGKDSASLAGCGQKTTGLAAVWIKNVPIDQEESSWCGQKTTGLAAIWGSV